VNGRRSGKTGASVAERGLTRMISIPRFDWFIKSRTPEELKRRAQTLLLCLTKEHNDLEKAVEPVKKGGKVSSALFVSFTSS
jgi:hypothetical protein